MCFSLSDPGSAHHISGGCSKGWTWPWAFFFLQRPERSLTFLAAPWTLEEMLGYRGARGRTAGSRCEPLDYFSTVYFFCKNDGYTGHFVTSSRLKNLGWKMDQLELAVKEDRILVMDETGGASRIDSWNLCSLVSFLILGSQATIIALR